MSLAAPIGTTRAGVTYWPAFAAALLALTAVRYLTLATSPLNLLPDEAQYWAWAQTLDFGYFSKPPMVAWAIAATTAACGDGEACVRAASPALHGITALLVFAIGRELGDERIGFWSGLAYATLPGVSFSAVLISTDVPLLLFWAAALFAFVRWLRSASARWAAALGMAVGLGLLSKYAMAYFVLCGALYLAVSREARTRVSVRQAALAVAIATALLAPNLLWNLRNGWPTIEHTAANANWSGDLFNAGEAVEFIAAQAGVFGPILFVVLLWRIVALRRGLSEAERLLLCFSVPMLVIVILQAFISRAHANWAAPAYVAATVLVTKWLLANDGRRMVAGASLAVHTVFALGLYSYVSGAVALEPPRLIEPITSRQRGWDTLAAELARELEKRPGSAVMADERKLIAELVYYMREQGRPVVMWDYDRPPRNFFEATARVGAATGERLLLVTADPRPAGIIDRFSHASALRTIRIPVGPTRVKQWYVYELEGLKRS